MPENIKDSRKKILVIDDNPVIQKALFSVLKANGFDVALASDGSEVITCLHQIRPDLILLDLLFPPNVAQGGTIWDGFLILEWLRRMGKAKSIPFIVVSGAEPEKYKSRCLAEGASAFFSKPIPFKELLEAIRLALENSAKSKPAADNLGEALELHLAAS